MTFWCMEHNNLLELLVFITYVFQLVGKYFSAAEWWTALREDMSTTQCCPPLSSGTAYRTCLTCSATEYMSNDRTYIYIAQKWELLYKQHYTFYQSFKKGKIIQNNNYVLSTSMKKIKTAIVFLCKKFSSLFWSHFTDALQAVSLFLKSDHSASQNSIIKEKVYFYL